MPAIERTQMKAKEYIEAEQPNWIIEARDEQGQLKFDCEQPESFFGIGAIKGISENRIADAIFRKLPDASLQGDQRPNWPKLINPHWTARRKTW
jgi:hypothetical protein